MKKLIKGSSGQATVEYILVGAIFCVAVIGGVYIYIAGLDKVMNKITAVFMLPIP